MGIEGLRSRNVWIDGGRLSRYSKSSSEALRKRLTLALGRLLSIWKERGDKRRIGNVLDTQAPEEIPFGNRSLILRSLGVSTSGHPRGRIQSTKTEVVT